MKSDYLNLRWISQHWFARTFRALRHRNFRLFWCGQVVSLTGTWMQWVAHSWLVLQLTNSAFLLGLVSSIGSFPVLIFSLLGGVVADRVNKRLLLIVTQSLAMLLAFVLAILTSLGWIQVWQIMLLAFILGVVNAFDHPARQVFIFEIVGKEDLLNAIALHSSIFNAARIIGPAIAGILVALIGVAGCFYLNVVSFLAVIAGLWMIRIDSSLYSSRQASIWDNMREGLSHIRYHRTILILIVTMAVVSIFGVPYGVLMPVFARDVLKAGASGLGFLMAATGTGALIGALTLATLGNIRRKGWFLLVGAFSFSLSLLLFSFSRSFRFSLICLVGAGWSLITCTATTNTLLQTLVPDALRGRVMSIFTLMFLGMAPLGSLQAGMVATHLGAPIAVGLGAFICMGYVLFIFYKFPRLRHLR